MAKAKTVFVCNECGYESPKWLGKCPACNSWNTFFEQKVVETKSETKSTVTGKAVKERAVPQVLDEVVGKNESRIDTGIGELNRVLGGGLVNGSLVLLGGEPGIGKSTLILELCDKITGTGKVLYVSGEESAEQVKLRADRLGIKNNNIMFLGETDIDVIEETILAMNPKLVIIDSIQTVSKGHQITTIIIGHVTKDGNIAGPRVLEHMVDTVLYLEGERYFSYRILRSVKNRFGSTNEIGMFEMQNEGMIEIKNPSQILISDREDNPPGSVIVASMEGTRPLLIELQALTTPSVFGIPKRAANGIDYNRLTMLIAVLEKKSSMPLGSQDVYLNVVSGIRLVEPAVDLGTVLAVGSSFRNFSSFRNLPLPKDMVAIGEVGLTGEIRAVNMIEKRVKEAEKMGFKTCIIPESNKKLLKDNFKMDIIGVRTINEAMQKAGLR